MIFGLEHPGFSHYSTTRLINQNILQTFSSHGIAYERFFRSVTDYHVESVLTFFKPNLVYTRYRKNKIHLSS